jgi:hypothetical protein
MNEGSVSQRVGMCVVFMCIDANEPQVVNRVTQRVTCDLPSNNFSFHLHLLNNVQVGAAHTIFDVAPQEIIVDIHVR